MQRKEDRNEQLELLRRRYQRRGKEGKSRLLDGFCEHFGYEGKYAIKLLGASLEELRPKHSPPGPEPKYQAVSEVITQVWKLAGQLCGKRLVQALPLWLPHYERHFGRLLPKQKKLLNEVSAATLDRLLAAQKAQSRKGLSGTRPGTLLRQHVPIQGEVWNFFFHTHLHI